MIQFTSADLDRFIRPGPQFFDAAKPLSNLIEAGDAKPEWCLLAESDGQVLARLGLFTRHDPHATVESRHPDIDTLRAARASQPMLLSSFAFGWVPEPAGERAAADLLREAASRVPQGAIVEFGTHLEVHENVAARLRIAGSAGYRLHQQKQGFSWAADDSSTPPELPDGLHFRSIVEVGVPAYLDVVARAVQGTRDRNDAHDVHLMGPANWARDLLEYLDADDEPTWCLAIDDTGEIVGHVAVSAFDEPRTATIIHVGVLPEHRGRGHGPRLIRAATALAAKAGYTAMICDADVRNAPSLASFVAAGHRDDARQWQVWRYRSTPSH